LTEASIRPFSTACYETRTWTGWHHHQALSLLAAWFLGLETRRGKKADAVNHGATGPDRPGLVAA